MRWCLTSIDPQFDREYFSRQRPHTAQAIRMLFFATSITFLADLIHDAFIKEQFNMIWIIFMLYISSLLICLVLYYLSKRFFSRGCLTECFKCLAIWVIFVLIHLGRALNDSLGYKNLILWNVVADIIFLSCGMFIIKMLQIKILHICGTFALGIASLMKEQTDTTYLIKILSAWFYIVVIVIYSYKVERDGQLRSFGIESEIKRIADCGPHGAVIINSSKKIVYSNCKIEKILTNAAEKTGTSTRMSNDRLYEVLTSKFQDLELLPHRSCVEGSESPLIGSAKTKFEIGFEKPTLNDVISSLIAQEKTARRTNAADAQKTYLVYRAPLNGRHYELHITYTAKKYIGSLLLLIVDTTVNQENSDLKLRNRNYHLATAYIVHELRTPLSSSLVMLNNITEYPTLPLEISEKLVIPAISSLKILMSLINDILDFSQLTENKLNLVFQPTSISGVIHDTLRVIRVLANLKNIKIYENISWLPGSFSTDSNRLQQVLMNLLSNAIKFTEAGGSVTISATVIQKVPCLIEISVEDTGIGISEEDQKKLFHDYTRIDLGNKAHLNASGCGLGLNFSNKIAMALARGSEDHMKVRSVRGQGSVFSFRILDKPSAEVNEKQLDLIGNSKAQETLNNIDYNDDFDENSKHGAALQPEQDISIKQGLVNMSYLAGSKVSSNLKVFHQDQDMDHINIDFSERETNFKSDRIEIKLSLDPKAVSEPIGVLKNKQIQAIQKSQRMLRKSHSEELGLLDQPESQNISAASPLHGGGGEPSVLVVDDDPVCLYAMEICINSIGIKAHYAHSGEEAYKFIEKRIEQGDPEDAAYKLVLMDRNMRPMDGLETTRRIRQLLSKRPDLNDYMVIIGTTALSTDSGRREMINAGMNDVVQKPIEKETLNRLFFRFKIFR